MTTAVETKTPLPPPPGPSLWAGLTAYKRDPAAYMHGLFLEYGDVLRWRGFMTIHMLNNPDHVRQILTQAHPEFTKNAYDYHVLAQTLGKGLVTNDGSDWVKQRRLMQPMFHNKIVNTFDQVINAFTAVLAERWNQLPADRPVALDREMSRVTFQIVAGTLFGSAIDEHADEMVDILDAININTKTLRAFFTLYPWIPTAHNRRFNTVMRRLDHIVYKIINGRRVAGVANKDLLDRLLSARDEPTALGMEEKQIRDEVVTLMLAGHETSSTALQWTFYLLAQHPEVEAELLGELNSVLNGNPAAAADLSRLPYLKQVVQESMRVYPPVWGIARRATNEQEFAGYRLPAGAYISILPYSLHRHPEHWPEPERFDPTRFSPQRSESRHSYAYIPFAAGPRTCIGAGMSMLEIQLVLAQLLPRFRLRPVPGHPVSPMATVTYRPRDGVKVFIEKR
ncbi:MAG: cytochrome P450 [Gammaproteobacteria bacterium]|nr:cytochrome P450 [Gammaproteobacteria bacterium]